jgi:hypothetical protein
MRSSRIKIVLIGVLCLVASVSGWQTSTASSSQATAFMGTWVISMTNPQGATETVRIWDEKGVVAASVQSGKSPPINATGILKDRDVLVLTLTRFENGKEDRAVISLTLDGDTMNMAQMLEFSQTIKRGSGKKQGK